jgi:hypothetical protein
LSLDLFGDRDTIFFGGRNRYYSGTLLTHALYSGYVTESQSRGTSGNDQDDWVTTSVIYSYGEDSVKTPYTDETTIGLIKQLLGGELKVQYLRKKSCDEFARHREVIDGRSVYTLNNFGKSEHQSIQLSWQRSWRHQQLVINGTWQETTTTNTDYHTTFDLDDTLESIWYDGKELYTFEIPRKDFNRPFIANLIYSHKFPYGLTFTNFVKYRGAYWKLSRVPGETHPSSSNPGENINVYEKVKSHNVVTFDWHLNWKLPSLVKQNIVLSLDVLNVFNKRAKIGYQTGTLGYDYELGRQIWAGVEFNF